MHACMLFFYPSNLSGLLVYKLTKLQPLKLSTGHVMTKLSAQCHQAFVLFFPSLLCHLDGKLVRTACL